MRAVKPGARLFSATVGYVIYCRMGTFYFYFITHFAMATPDTVGWGAIFAVCCLLITIPGYILCILAVAVAGRLRPSIGRFME